MKRILAIALIVVGCTDPVSTGIPNQPAPTQFDADSDNTKVRTLNMPNNVTCFLTSDYPADLECVQREN